MQYELGGGYSFLICVCFFSKLVNKFAKLCACEKQVGSFRPFFFFLQCEEAVNRGQRAVYRSSTGGFWDH